MISKPCHILLNTPKEDSAQGRKGIIKAREKKDKKNPLLQYQQIIRMRHRRHQEGAD